MPAWADKKAKLLNQPKGGSNEKDVQNARPKNKPNRRKKSAARTKVSKDSPPAK